MKHQQASTIPAWLGIDVAKDSFVAALDVPWQPGTVQVSLQALPARKFPRTREGAGECLRWAREQMAACGHDAPPRAIMEAMGNYSLELLFWLVELCPRTAPAVVNPHQTARYLESRSTRRKDDATDARGLARLGTERSPAPTDPPAGDRLRLRETLRWRAALVAERDAQRSRLAAFMQTDPQLARMMRRQIEHTGKLVGQCEKLARKLVRRDAAMKADVDSLSEIFGIGELTAMTVVAELGDLRRFASDRQLASYCGLCPRVRESGKRKGQVAMSKLGNQHVRRVLYMCAIVNVRFDKTAQGEWYHRKVAEGKHPMVALMGLMRKLLSCMYHVLRTGMPCRAFPQTPQTAT